MPSLTSRKRSSPKYSPNKAFGYWKVYRGAAAEDRRHRPREDVHTAKEIRELRATGQRSESAPCGHQEDPRAECRSQPPERTV